MSQNEVIEQIKAQKKLPNLKFSIKEKTEAFTNNLFYTLFDEETPVEENIVKLGKDFEELADLVCWQPDTPCRDIWQEYLDKLPGILEKLNKDARAISENDPAANSLEEVILSYPVFLPLLFTALVTNFTNLDFRWYRV